MADDSDETAENRYLGAHTRAAPPENRADRASSEAAGDDLASSVRQIAEKIAAPDGEQLDLIAGSPDLDDIDVLARAANQVATERRGRGRPTGSVNERNTKVFDYLEALGHRDPATTLSMVQTADTMELARALGSPARDAKGKVLMRPVLVDGKPVPDGDGYLFEPIIEPADPVKILAQQIKAATDLLPYKYAQRPQQIELPEGAPRPVVVIGDMNVSQVKQSVYMTLGGPAKKANEINGDVVRNDDANPHETENASDNSDLGTKSS